MACYYETRVKANYYFFFYFLQFGFDTICGQKNTLYIKFVSSDSSLRESSLGGTHAHLPRKKLSAG